MPARRKKKNETRPVRQRRRTPDRLSFLRGRLLERRRRLLENLATLEDVSNIRSIPLPGDQYDMASESLEDEMRLRAAEIRSQGLTRVDEALARIEEGSYGRCKECGRRIPAARLRIMPDATLCAECQRRYEFEETDEESHDWSTSAAGEDEQVVPFALTRTRARR